MLSLSVVMWLMSTVVCVSGVLGLAEGRAGDWEEVKKSDGLLVERRQIDGMPLPEIRVTAHTWVPPAAVFDTIWRQREYPEFVPYLKRTEVIAETPDERIVYEQVAMPLVRDRDYTVRVRKKVDPEAQRYEASFVSVGNLGPAPNKGYIRATDIKGSWLVEPDGNGRGSVVRYVIRSDPGGTLPAWAVKIGQGSAAADLVEAMIKRAGEKYGPIIRAPGPR